MVYEGLQDMKDATPTTEEITAIVDQSYAPPSDERQFDQNSVSGKIMMHSIKSLPVPLFEFCTISVIILNALCILYDTEYTATIGKPDGLYDGPIQFIVLELFFAVYFTIEILMRFVADVEKNTLWKDSWFVFDSGLVILMLLETFVFPFMAGGGPAGLSVIRLFRLIRMVKIAKSIPELMTIVKGLIQAIKAVSWCAFLEMLLTYVFAIIFTQQYHNGFYMSDPCEDSCEGDSANDFFGSLPRAAYSLVIFGSFFDDLTMCVDSLRSREDWVYVLIFLLYMVLSGFIVMNMVIGILAEVITATGCEEKMSQKNDILGAAIRSIKAEMDTDNSGCISRHEFDQMKDHESVIKALEMLEIEEDDFNRIGDVMFEKDRPEDEDKQVKLPDLVETILKFQPDTEVSAVNIANLETSLRKSLKEIEKELNRLERVVAHSNGECTFEELHRSGLMRPSTTLNNMGTPLIRGSLLDADTGDIPKSAQDVRWAGVRVKDILNEIQRRMSSGEGNPTGPHAADKGGSSCAEPSLPGVPDIVPDVDITAT